MDSLNKIKTYISWLTRSSEKRWKKEVQIEKKQKYLFGAGENSTRFERSRNTSKVQSTIAWYRVFSTFFQEQIATGDLVKNYGYIMSMIGLMLILLSVYIVAFSPYFKISPNQVMVEAMTPWVDIGIAYRSLEGIYGQSIFLLDEADIARRLQLSLRNLERVSIDRYYPNGVKVLITGTPILLDTTITGIDAKRWWLSNNGILIPEKDLWDTKVKYHLDIVKPALIGDLFLSYKQAIEESDMHTILEILQIFSTEWSTLTLDHSRYYGAENELHLILKSGTHIILALQDDSESRNWTTPKNIIDQITTLRTYISENTAKIIDESIVYIDARIPFKLFVCSDKILCQKNLSLIYGESL